METETKKVVSISPKGLIFLALGGYVGEETGLNSRENSDKVMKSLIDFMSKTDTALLVIDGELNFVTVKEKKRKKFLGIF